MFDRRYEISFELEVCAPLHVGTGEREPVQGVVMREGENSGAEVARIVRDVQNRPYLPATTMKGLFRRLAEEHAPESVERLFGSIKHSETKSGAMGRLLFRGAALCPDAPDVSNYPFVQTASAELGPGVFVAARTAVEPLAGTARDHRLFLQEMVAEGVRFSTSIVLTGPKGADRADLDKLLAALSLLATDEGTPCGRGKNDGSGALRLWKSSLKVVEKSIGSDGELTSSSVPAVLPTTPSLGHEVRRESRVLSCDGPFFSADSSHDPRRGGSQAPDAPQGPQLVPQKGRDGGPLELGSQISGALRARSRYLAGLVYLEAGGQPDLNTMIKGIDRADHTIRSPQEAADLSAVERLFGVTGFAGLLRIVSARYSGGELVEATSVKLDHFSGAPIDKALFTTRAFRGVRLELVLELAGRGPKDGVGQPTDDDRALFTRLIEDLDRNGIRLGHATGRGYGWFRPAQEAGR